jgi:hypothetical protein
MKKILHVSTGKTAFLYLLLLVSLGFLGCAVGRIVPVDDRILFDDKKTGQGSFSRNSLTVQYSYRLTGGKMTMDGRVDHSFPVDSLEVRLLFLDTAGKVLQQKLVYYSGYRLSWPWMAERTFQETLVVPEGAIGISFDYSAQPRSSQK